MLDLGASGTMCTTSKWTRNVAIALLLWRPSAILALRSCRPKMCLEEQLSLTWFTNAVKCSAATSGGNIPRRIEETCVSSYVKREIEALPNAYVLALGEKARRRLRAADVRVNGHAQHPGARPNTNPRASWEEAAKQFRTWVSVSPSLIAP